jgi:hypothetical protein
LGISWKRFTAKHQSDEGLLRAITALLSGRIYVPPWVAQDDDHKPEVQFSINIGQEKLELTRRQGDVLPLLALGMSNKEVAQKSNIAEKGRSRFIWLHFGARSVPVTVPKPRFWPKILLDPANTLQVCSTTNGT